MGVKQLREKKGWTVTQLAKISGVRYQKIWQIENGSIKAEHIMLRTAQKLAEALGCAPADLLEAGDGE